MLAWNITHGSLRNDLLLKDSNIFVCNANILTSVPNCFAEIVSVERSYNCAYYNLGFIALCH